MATRSKKVLKTLAKTLGNDDSKKKTPSGYNKDGSPKNWQKVLKKVPMNRDVKIKDLPPAPVFRDEEEKQRFIEMLHEASKTVDWTKEFNQSVKDDVVQIDFTGCGEGRVHESEDCVSNMLTPRESQRIGKAINLGVQKVNKSFTIPGQVTDDPKFILPVPAKDSGTKIDENDIPEYVLAAFIHPAPGFSLESEIEIGCTVRIAYQRDPEFFAATIRIGELRGLGEQMSIYSLVTKDGAKYAVNGVFTAESMASGKQPRALKLYNYLREKLGLA